MDEENAFRRGWAECIAAEIQLRNGLKALNAGYNNNATLLVWNGFLQPEQKLKICEMRKWYKLFGGEKREMDKDVNNNSPGSLKTSSETISVWFDS